MKRLILLIILLPLIATANEPSLKDYYRMGYDEGIDFAKSNKSINDKSFCSNAGYCLSLSFTDVVMGITTSAAFVMLAPLVLSDEAIYDGWGFFTQTAFQLSFEMFVMRCAGLIYERLRIKDEFDILKKRKDFINDSYKAGFIDGAKSIYNKKVKF
ncbi:MAG: hypothetical protein AB7T10_02470 [bacterium]